MSHLKHQNLLHKFDGGHEPLPPVHHASAGKPPAPSRRSNSAVWFTAVKVIFFAALLILALVLAMIGFNLKHISAIVSNVSQGKANLESSLVSAQENDFAKAGELAGKATKSFEAAAGELDSVRLGPFAYLPMIREYKAEAGHLARGGQYLGEAMSRSASFAYSFEDVIGKSSKSSFSKLPVEEKRRILSAIYNAEAPLGEMSSSLDKSMAEFSELKSFAWLQPVSGRIDELKAKIELSRKTLGEASPLTRLLPPLLGYPKTANFLFVLQNSDELRPTGGFIGTYGIIQAKDGDFTRFETHDVYHLDMPVKDKVTVTPPGPIGKYLVDKWYLRDANWSPDWPTSAEKVLWFYKAENAAMDKPDPLQEFDGVIAVTPELITDLMKLTGPIAVGGETYTSANFVDLLQYKVEKDYVRLGVSSWQRKEVIAEISKAIKEKLLDLPLERWSEMIRLLGDNMARKNILLYSRDPALQKLIRDQGWSGEIKNTWGDYLMAVDANLGALKTDAVMERQISYRLEQQPNGDLKAVATLHYAHNGGVDWKTSRYQSYTRLYVPAGSKLLKMTGAAAGSETAGEEAGRAFFGGYLVVPPRGTADLSFEYLLPRQVSDNMKTYNNYALLVQKQPGSQGTRLTVDARFNNKIKSYNPVNLNTDAKEGNRLRSDGSLTIDRSFLVNF